MEEVKVYSLKGILKLYRWFYIAKGKVVILYYLKKYRKKSREDHEGEKEVKTL